MEYYSAIKRNTLESVLMRQMNLEPIIQSEVSKKEKNEHYILTHLYGLERWYWWIYFQGSNGDTDIENRLMDTGRGEEGEEGMYGESNTAPKIAKSQGHDHPWLKTAALILLSNLIESNHLPPPILLEKWLATQYLSRTDLLRIYFGLSCYSQQRNE